MTVGTNLVFALEFGRSQGSPRRTYQDVGLDEGGVGFEGDSLGVVSPFALPLEGSDFPSPLGVDGASPLFPFFFA